MSNYAWVTLATNDSYALGALVVANSLKRVNTIHQLAVLITPGVSESMKRKLEAAFTVVVDVNVLDSQDAANLALLSRPELGITFTKVHCWRLTQFEKCVFLDADTFVLQNADELFEREELSAAPDVGWPDCFNSGVFVFKPSLDTFGKLIEFATRQGSFDGGDQGLLNSFFSDWAQKDISKHLPFIYNTCSTACYSYLPAFKQFGQNVKILHFIGQVKPWLLHFDFSSKTVNTPQGFGHLGEYLQQWWNIFCSDVHPSLTTEMGGLAGALAQITLGAPRTAEQQAYEENMRRQCWEAGNIDYLVKVGPAFNESEENVLTSTQIHEQTVTEVTTEGRIIEKKIVTYPGEETTEIEEVEEVDGQTMSVKRTVIGSENKDVKPKPKTKEELRNEPIVIVPGYRTVVIDEKTNSTIVTEKTTTGHQQTITTIQEDGTKKIQIKTFFDPVEIPCEEEEEETYEEIETTEPGSTKTTTRTTTVEREALDNLISKQETNLEITEVESTEQNATSSVKQDEISTVVKTDEVFEKTVDEKENTEKKESKILTDLKNQPVVIVPGHQKVEFDKETNTTTVTEKTTTGYQQTITTVTADGRTITKTKVFFDPVPVEHVEETTTTTTETTITTEASDSATSAKNISETQETIAKQVTEEQCIQTIKQQEESQITKEQTDVTTTSTDVKESQQSISETETANKKESKVLTDLKNQPVVIVPGHQKVEFDKETNTTTVTEKTTTGYQQTITTVTSDGRTVTQTKIFYDPVPVEREEIEETTTTTTITETTDSSGKSVSETDKKESKILTDLKNQPIVIVPGHQKVEYDKETNTTTVTEKTTTGYQQTITTVTADGRTITQTKVFYDPVPVEQEEVEETTTTTTITETTDSSNSGKNVSETESKILTDLKNQPVVIVPGHQKVEFDKETNTTTVTEKTTTGYQQTITTITADGRTITQTKVFYDPVPVEHVEETTTTTTETTVITETTGSAASAKNVTEVQTTEVQQEQQCIQTIQKQEESEVTKEQIDTSTTSTNVKDLQLVPTGPSSLTQKKTTKDGKEVEVTTTVSEDGKIKTLKKTVKQPSEEIEIEEYEETEEHEPGEVKVVTTTKTIPLVEDTATATVDTSKTIVGTVDTTKKIVDTVDTSKTVVDTSKTSIDTKTKVDKTKTKVDEIKTKVDKTKTKVDETKTKVDETKTKVDETKTKVDETKTKVDISKTKVDESKNKKDTTKNTQVAVKDTNKKTQVKEGTKKDTQVAVQEKNLSQIEKTAKLTASEVKSEVNISAKQTTTATQQVTTEAKQTTTAAKQTTTAAKQTTTAAKQTTTAAKQTTVEAKQTNSEAKQTTTTAKQTTTAAKQTTTEAKQITTEAKQTVTEAKQTLTQGKQSAIEAKQIKKDTKQIKSDTDTSTKTVAKTSEKDAKTTTQAVTGKSTTVSKKDESQLKLKTTTGVAKKDTVAKTDSKTSTKTSTSTDVATVDKPKVTTKNGETTTEVVRRIPGGTEHTWTTVRADGTKKVESKTYFDVVEVEGSEEEEEIEEYEEVEEETPPVKTVTTKKLGPVAGPKTPTVTEATPPNTPPLKPLVIGGASKDLKAEHEILDTPPLDKAEQLRKKKLPTAPVSKLVPKTEKSAVEAPAPPPRKNVVKKPATGK